MNVVFIGIIAYVVLQFIIGAWVSRGVSSVADFVIAGRKLGLGLVMFSVFATFFGAEAIIATGGAVYEQGLAGSHTDPLAYGIAIVLAGLLLAATLWRRGLMTFADLFRERYGSAIEKLVVIVLLPGSLFWAAAQMRSFGQIVSATSGLSVEAAILIAAVAVLGYSVLGGLLADAWTDLVQGICIVLGLLVLLVAVIAQGGGLGASFAKVEPDRLNLLTIGDGGLLGLIESFAVPIGGTLVAVELISRMLAARAPEVARAGTINGGIVYMLAGTIPVTIALLGAPIVGKIDEPEQIIPMLATALLSPLLQVILLGAIVSAILSTVDTVLLASSAQVSQNLLPTAAGTGEPQRLLRARAVLMALGAAACLLALTSDKVKDLVETASAAGSAGVLVVLIFAISGRFGGPLAAAATLAVGALSWLVLANVVGSEVPYVLAVLLSAATYLIVAMLEPVRPTGRPQAEHSQ